MNRLQSGAPRRARYGRLVPVAAGVLVALAGIAACVDGVTPNCSAPGAQCKPSLDGGTDVSQLLPEAGDAGDEAEAAADPDADAGDEG
jgi:hypothetical protein